MLTVILSADQFGSELARAEIWAGLLGPITVTVTANYPGQAQSFNIEGALGPNPKLTVYFKNDAYGGAADKDRNLYLMGAVVDGTWYPPPLVNKISTSNAFAQIRLTVPPTIASFYDDFLVPNFIPWDGKNWPPLPNTGRWSRCYYYGWPGNTGSQDCAARSLANNHEAQCYEDRGVTIDQRGLVLTATKDSSNHHNLPWTSGCIVQARELALLYGYFEADIKTPNLKGFWPAFWLLAVSRKYPPELDVMEQVCLDANKYWNPQIYRAGCVGGSGAGHWQDMGDNGISHKYGMLWTEDTVSFFFDRKLIGGEPTPASAREPMFMLLDLAVGAAGSWPNVPDASVTKAEMIVSNVRAYALGSWGGTLLPNF